MTGVLATGSTELVRRASGALGDLLNISIASLMLALVIVIALRNVKYWELAIAVIPAFVMNLIYFFPMFKLPGNAWITAGVFLILLAVLPFVSTRLVANIIYSKEGRS